MGIGSGSGSGGSGGSSGSNSGGGIDKDDLITEGSNLFISKTHDDFALGQITFRNGIATYGDIFIGDYVPGFLGSGGKFDKDGNGEIQSLVIREFLEVPELRFNKIDVVSGELWNSIAYGTIESVDEANQVFTVKLEEGEYSGLHVNDICRGIFHNLGQANETEETVDDSGFDTIRGFGTSYFTPIEVFGSYDKNIRYALKPGCKYHPKPAMKFAVYGNFTDESRQSSSYSTRNYKRFLKNVNTWGITW